MKEEKLYSVGFTYEVEGRAEVWAKSAKEARIKIKKGESNWDTLGMEDKTFEDIDIKSIINIRRVEISGDTTKIKEV